MKQADEKVRRHLSEEKQMKITKLAPYLAGGILALTLAAPPQAKADDWDQKITFTFSGPVEIPGQVLPAGTYVFKLADSNSDRNIVEVFNKNEKQLYGIFLTIPDYRLKPRSKPIITFDERPADAPEAVRAWFYPGENYGHAFVYPKKKAVALAKANNQPVPSMPDEMSANTTKPTQSVDEPHVVEMKQATLKAQQPTEEEVEIAEVFTSPITVDGDDAPGTLPKTGSLLPLIALIGLLSAVVAGSLQFVLGRAK